MSARRWAVLALAAVVATGCNRAAFRSPGASTSFPPTTTGYQARRTYAETLAVLPPADVRPQHYGERVAGTRWTGCRTDGFLGDDGVALLGDRLTRELAASHLFAQVQGPAAPADALVLRTEVRAFCAQAIGFIYLRVAGIVALHWTLGRGDRALLDGTIEHVVTDADPEYTGSPVGTIEQAMHRTMADALRLTLRDLVDTFEQRLENEAG